MMLTHPAINMVPFTGSMAVGKLINQASAETLKKAALEPGGNNPQGIFPDAYLADAADAVTFGTYFNVGQCCNSSSRIIVHEDITDAFAQSVVALSNDVGSGVPLDPDTQVDTIITAITTGHADHNARVDVHVQTVLSQGAQLELEGASLKVPSLGNQFYQPKIISQVQPNMDIAKQEVFDPVLVVSAFRAMDGAVVLANNNGYPVPSLWRDKHSGQGREIGQYGFDEVSRGEIDHDARGAHTATLGNTQQLTLWDIETQTGRKPNAYIS
ncbi:MAG: aldehyde dehydrogenase family protein [Rhodobacteraceae bacterium]|nr:aldehyde dehydrogenase family protein [Paracoccaceae bacterium]